MDFLKFSEYIKALCVIYCTENDKNWEKYEKEMVSVYKSYVAVQQLSYKFKLLVY